MGTPSRQRVHDAERELVTFLWTLHRRAYERIDQELCVAMPTVDFLWSELSPPGTPHPAVPRRQPLRISARSPHLCRGVGRTRQPGPILGLPQRSRYLPTVGLHQTPAQRRRGFDRVAGQEFPHDQARTPGASSGPKTSLPAKSSLSPPCRFPSSATRLSSRAAGSTRPSSNWPSSAPSSKTAAGLRGQRTTLTRSPSKSSSKPTPRENPRRSTTPPGLTPARPQPTASAPIAANAAPS